ncbi:MAG: AzlD domain-containing protein [Anaerolineales bacterium]|nr:AzlD domain-containing protein [Anaerolineales bacterium]
MRIWLILLLGGALTFATRLSFIYLFGRFEMPEVIRRALKYVPPAVLSALIAPALFMPGGVVDIRAGNYRLLAGAAAVLVAWRARSTLWTIVAGMAALAILTGLSGIW